jgi:hypothetical protein
MNLHRQDDLCDLMISIHERSAREKISASQVARILFMRIEIRNVVNW